jgi:hypothetical protein
LQGWSARRVCWGSRAALPADHRCRAIFCCAGIRARRAEWGPGADPGDFPVSFALSPERGLHRAGHHGSGPSCDHRVAAVAA